MPDTPAKPIAGLLTRIKGVTTTVPQLEIAVRAYRIGLGYRLREEGEVSAALATAWQAPASAGRRYALLSSDTAPDVFVRFVEATPVPGYTPLLSFGWNAFEIVVDDVYALRRQLQGGPFRIIGEPRPLGARPSVHAMQVIGPGAEVLYLTTETGDRDTSPLPPPLGTIGRPFIVVLGGPDILALRDFYADAFALQANPIRASRGQTVQRAWGGTADGTHPITLLRLGEHGNSIELNGYVKPGLSARQQVDGELPPGNAIASFSVPSLELPGLELPGLDLPGREVLSTPQRHHGLAYAGSRAASFIGPAGERVELVEEPARAP